MHFLSKSNDVERIVDNTELEKGDSVDSQDDSGSNTSLSEPESVDQVTVTSTVYKTTANEESESESDERPAKRVKVETNVKVELESKVTVSI